MIGIHQKSTFRPDFLLRRARVTVNSCNTKTATKTECRETPLKVSAFDVTALLCPGPPCALLFRIESTILRFWTAKTRRKKKNAFEKTFMLKSVYHVDSI